MLTQTEYKYDIAFSFLAKDEHIARQLADILDNYSTFIYSKRQEEIAGTDGEISFGEVFGHEARLVVVLFRSDWGQTPWTRIEETAIRNRAFSEGYDFVLFIPLATGDTMPIWLPRTQLWVGIERWGIENAASVIDARHQSFGEKTKGSSIEQRIESLTRARDASEYKKQLYKSESGVIAFNTYFDNLIEIIERQITEIRKKQEPQVSTERLGQSIMVISEPVSLWVQWRNTYSNVLDDSKILATLWLGPPRHPNHVYYEVKKPIQEISLTPDVISKDQLCWTILSQSTKKQLPNEHAAEYLLRWWISHSIETSKK